MERWNDAHESSRCRRVRDARNTHTQTAAVATNLRYFHFVAHAGVCELEPLARWTTAVGVASSFAFDLAP